GADEGDFGSHGKVPADLAPEEVKAVGLLHEIVAGAVNGEFVVRSGEFGKPIAANSAGVGLILEIAELELAGTCHRDGHRRMGSLEDHVTGRFARRFGLWRWRRDL